MVTYDLAVNLWRSSEIVVVRDSGGRNIGLFPVAFIRDGGDDSWGYIFSVLTMLVDIPEGISWSVKNDYGNIMSEGSSPVAGAYTMEMSGSSFSPVPYQYR